MATELIHHKPKSTPNCFLCCFGFPGQKQQLSRKKSDAKKKNKTTTLCFTWARFRIKRSSSTKTVPLDSTVPSENINLSLNCPNPTKEDLPKPLDQNAAAASSHNQSSKETKINNELHQHRRTKDDATFQKRLSFRRKIDSIRTSSHPASPDTAKPKDRRPNVVISRSTTFPVPDRVKWVGSPSTQSQVINEKEFSKLDPIVGFSIVAITILIMLLWGRLCAILCTSAWFYFVPRLRSSYMDHSGTNASGSKPPDLDSEEYKKRVVMEGFLQRNNHHHHRQRSTV